MFILIAVFAVVVLSMLTISIVRRQNRELFENARSQPISGEGLRPLFASTADDLRAAEREESASRKRELEEEINAASAAEFQEFIRNWRARPNKQNSLELVRLASEQRNAASFSEVAEEITTFHREFGIDGLSQSELADLLDSHYRLLPPEVRGSGAIFRLKEEIAELRSVK